MTQSRYLLCILFLLTLSPSRAQQKKAVIYRAKVELLNGETIKGYLLALNDSTIEITDGNNRSISNTLLVQEIKEIGLRRKNSVGKGLLVGLGAGALLGAGVGFMTYTPCTSCFIDFGPGLSTIGGALIGTVAGGVFGAVAGSGTKKFVINGNINSYNQLRYNPVFSPKTTNASPIMDTHN